MAMNKVIRIALLLVLAGAVASVGVAWACSLFSEIGVFDPHFMARLRSERWEDEDRSPALEDEGLWIESAWRGPGLVVVEERYDDPPIEVRSYRAGWPFAALGARAVTPRVDPSSDPTAHRWGIRLPAQMVLLTDYLPGKNAWGNRRKVSRVVPFFPLWPGFIASTFTYAVAIGVVWLSAWSVRRAVRRWRGRCPACGYDLQRDLAAGCSECGWRRASVASTR